MNDQQTGQRVGDALRQHVPDQPRAPFDLTDVKVRAGAIRRRRTTLSVAVAAAAAAVITPTAFLALGDGPTRDPVAPTTQSPEPVPAPRDDVTLSADAPRGAGAAGWFNPTFRDDALPPGASSGPSDQVSSFGDRWIVTHEGVSKLRVVDPDGKEPPREYPSVSAFAINSDRDLAAYVGADETVRLLSPDGKERILSKLPGPDPYAVVVSVEGGAACVDAPQPDCRVLLSFDSRSPMFIDGDGRFDEVDEKAIAATAIHGSVVALKDPAEEGQEAPCTRIVDLEKGPVWNSCDIAVQSFSPDGTLALVEDAYQSGWGEPRVGIADAATGEVLFWIDSHGEQGGIPRAVWEDTDHVVVTSFDSVGQNWRLFRVSTTGEVGQAGDPFNGDDQAWPFVAPRNP